MMKALSGAVDGGLLYYAAARLGGGAQCLGHFSEVV
jgi:hypothetical protein